MSKLSELSQTYSTPLWVSFFVVLFVTSFVSYLALGAVALPFKETIACLFEVIVNGEDSARELYPRTTAIVIHIRLPRAVAAILAGSALAMSGAAMQGLFRNPMASPDILGVSAGSSLGAVVAIGTGLSFVHPMILPLFATITALTTAFIVYGLAGRGQVNLLFVILAGMAISSLLNGVVSAVLLFSQQYEVSQYIFWTMGGLEGRMWQHILWPLPFIIIGIIALTLLAPSLNLIALGEENAHSMGLSVKKIKLLTLFFVAILTSMAISVAGPVGFVGLMIPHIMRLLTGANHRQLLPYSAIAGALFVLLCDLLGRWLFAPHEIKVGIVTAIIGGTYFVFLILKIAKRGRL